jgi:hypothetical protein
MPDIVLQTVCAIPSAGDGYVRVSESVAADGSLLFLFVEPSGAADVSGTTESPGWATFPKPRMEQPRRFRLVRVAADGSAATIDLPPLDLTFPMVDVFPDGRVLVAGPRCSWRSETDFDRNGAVIDPKTGTVSRILLGDGIENLFVDTSGRIWVGYFDEGVFGNFGWSDPGPPPIGSSGAVVFDASGTILWKYPQEGRNPSIDDCHGMNVSADSAAIFFYSDFPVCTITPGFALSFFPTPLRGCNAFAIAGNRVLFSGQYNDAAHTGYRGILNPDRAAQMEQVTFLHPGGTPIQAARIIGRGGKLHFFAQDGVFAAELNRS